MNRPLANRRGRPAALAVAAFGMAGVLWLIIPQAVHGSFPGRNGLIAVAGASFDFGCRTVSSIHVARSDGSGLRPVSPSRKCDGRWGPDWSADGQRLLFVDGAGGSLGVMSADGSDARRVSSPQFDVDPFRGINSQPSSSPDGRRAVFEVGVDPGDDDLAYSVATIWVAALDGTGARQVRHGRTPRWSPNGRVIAYITPGGALGLLDAGTERSILVRRFPRHVVLSVDWSPDGRRLLMVMGPRHTDARNSLATVVAADPTSRPTRIALPRRVRSPWDVWQAVSSPDGRRIAFVAYRQFAPNDGGMSFRAGVWVMRSRGGHPKRVVRGGFRNDVAEASPDVVSWQPIVP